MSAVWVPSGADLADDPSRGTRHAILVSGAIVAAAGSVEERLRYPDISRIYRPVSARNGQLPGKFGRRARPRSERLSTIRIDQNRKAGSAAVRDPTRYPTEFDAIVEDAIALEVNRIAGIESGACRVRGHIQRRAPGLIETPRIAGRAIVAIDIVIRRSRESGAAE